MKMILCFITTERSVTRTSVYSPSVDKSPGYVTVSLCKLHVQNTTPCLTCKLFRKYSELLTIGKRDQKSHFYNYNFVDMYVHVYMTEVGNIYFLKLLIIQ